MLAAEAVTVAGEGPPVGKVAGRWPSQHDRLAYGSRGCRFESCRARHPRTGPLTCPFSTRTKIARWPVVDLLSTRLSNIRANTRRHGHQRERPKGRRAERAPSALHLPPASCAVAEAVDCPLWHGCGT